MTVLSGTVQDCFTMKHYSHERRELTAGVLANNRSVLILTQRKRLSINNDAVNFKQRISVTEMTMTFKFA